MVANTNADQGDLFYDNRFLESWAGSIVSNPQIAIVELVANCWDAYATQVDIEWPTKTSSHFSISDNGIGMTLDEFKYIWRTLSYDRVTRYGHTINPPSDVIGLPRPVFGRSGKGRFATFCFADEYTVQSKKDGQEFTYRVYRTPDKPLRLELLNLKEQGVKGHGTIIRGQGELPSIPVSEDQAREILGGRFLANPAFKVFVNKRQVTFNDISKDCLGTYEVSVKGVGKAEILHIDTGVADRTTKQHGIAWWVLKRAVGECKWTGSDIQKVLDGRTSEAKRFTFIVQADCLKEADAVLADWSGFKEDSEAWAKLRNAVQQKIRHVIEETNNSERMLRKQAVMSRIGGSVNKLPPLSKERVRNFVNEVVDKCPNFGEQEVLQLSTILTNLEQSKSRYGLLEILHNSGPDDLDALHEILSEWTVGMAKLVLDEIQTRLKLIGELRAKIGIAGIDEVQELQPLFSRGLWMFGAQFESIEFTSNKGMTTVIRELFKNPSGKGSRNRPDFVVLPDSTVGFYARASYNEHYDEDGIEHLVIVDLKTTELSLGNKEKEQVWKYVKELRTRGHLRDSTTVDGFVLGTEIEQGEGEVTKHGDNVRVMPMLYQTILLRAEKRLLNLYEKVQSAPFLDNQRKELREFASPIDVVQPELTG